MRLLVFVLCLACFSTNLFAEDRTEIHVFEYQTVGETQREVFRNFFLVLSDKIPLLADELLNEDLGYDFEMLADVKVAAVFGNAEAEAARSNIASLNGRRNYWRDKGSLVLLTGRVVSPAEHRYSVRSIFFVGDFSALLGRSNFSVELPVTARNYDTTQDSHSVAILVTLAMSMMISDPVDSSADCSREAAGLELLNQADQRAKSVMMDDVQLGQRLEQLVNDAVAGITEACQ